MCKVLSVREPWAHQLCSGRKVEEVRSWRTRHRGRPLIHVAGEATIIGSVEVWGMRKVGDRWHWRVRNACLCKRLLGGEGEPPAEIRGGDCLAVIESLIEGYKSVAWVLAERRSAELPWWRRKAMKKRFMDAINEKAAKVRNMTDLWLGST